MIKEYKIVLDITISVKAHNKKQVEQIITSGLVIDDYMLNNYEIFE